MTNIKIWLAGTNTLTTHGLGQLLKTNGYDIKVENIDELRRNLQEITNYPDIIIWEERLLRSLNNNVLDITEHFNKKTKTVFILSQNCMHFLGLGLNNGIQGFLHVRSEITELKSCIDNVIQGSIFISPLFSGQQKINDKKWKHLKEVEKLLTSQERKILSEVGKGKTSKKIAADLNLSYKTIQNHRQNICRKLGLRGRNMLFEFAKNIIN